MYQEPEAGTAERLANADAVRARVEQDIEFLTDRITALKSLPRPNHVVIDTYQTMLDSRRSVLKWFQHGQVTEAEPQRNACPTSQ